jgi:hypothetical protein
MIGVLDQNGDGTAGGSTQPNAGKESCAISLDLLAPAPAVSSLPPSEVAIDVLFQEW